MTSHLDLPLASFASCVSRLLCSADASHTSSAVHDWSWRPTAAPACDIQDDRLCGWRRCSPPDCERKQSQALEGKLLARASIAAQVKATFNAHLVSVRTASCDHKRRTKTGGETPAAWVVCTAKERRDEGGEGESPGSLAELLGGRGRMLGSLVVFPLSLV